MFRFRLDFTPKFSRMIGSYNLPVEDGDTVKVRTTHPGVSEDDKKGEKGTVIGIMQMVTVKFNDGTIRTYNRDELSLRIPGLDEMIQDMIDHKPNEPWK